MSRTIEIVLYQYDELSEKAQEKAREWFRKVSSDDEHWESTYEDAERIAELMGIEFAQSRHRDGVDIQFSGFWSQGDGASFTGTYSAVENAEAAVRDYAPKDETLHAIAAEFDRLQGLYDGKLHATITRSTAMNYVHEYMMDCDAFDVDSEGEDSQLGREEEKPLLDNFRAFAKWIYRQLEAEEEYQTSDEVVADNIRSNDYDFYADGTRARP